MSHTWGVDHTFRVCELASVAYRNTIVNCSYSKLDYCFPGFSLMEKEEAVKQFEAKLATCGSDIESLQQELNALKQSNQVSMLCWLWHSRLISTSVTSANCNQFHSAYKLSNTRISQMVLKKHHILRLDVLPQIYSINTALQPSYLTNCWKMPSPIKTWYGYSNVLTAWPCGNRRKWNVRFCWKICFTTSSVIQQKKPRLWN